MKIDIKFEVFNFKESRKKHLTFIAIVLEINRENL